MKLFGLTGGIGMGKSTAAKILSQRGVPIIDSDAIARELVEPGRPALGEIRAAFGAGVIDSTGRLDRAKLAAIVFDDAEARKKLEAILHPRIRATWLAQAEVWRAESRALGVVVIPLLYETGAEKNFDAIVCIACSELSQAQRLRERGWSDEQIAARNCAQIPIAKKMALANFVVRTEGDVAIHAEQLRRVFQW
jgi:dephospho-CoA kinase